MPRLVPVLLAMLCLATAHLSRAEELRIALQPLGKISADVVEKVRAHLEQIYVVKVEVLPVRELPASAFYKPRQRYRADKLLDWLDSSAPANFTKTVGLTASDISTTKGEVFDWGVFGLGTVGGRPCVISTFRLGRSVSREKLLLRTQRVAAHEVGHTFGLEHCPTPGCMMSDAEGKISTVDEETGRLCERCATRVPARKGDGR